MNSTLLLVVVLLSVASLVPVLNAQTSTYTRPLRAASVPPLLSAPALSSLSTSSTATYWFQVGVLTPKSVTGASVEIHILTPQRSTHEGDGVAYWVGVDLANDAFVQVGYSNYGSGSVGWFFEYFLPGTAAEVSGGFLGTGGRFSSNVRNGSWVKFTVQSIGTTWQGYVNGLKVGSVDLQIQQGYRVAAIAEVPSTQYVDERLGPVEFRNLAYRDLTNSWQNMETASAYVGCGAGSAKLGSAEPYHVYTMVGVNNYWVAGSELNKNVPSCNGPLQASTLCEQHDLETVWPWYKVQVVSQFGSTEGSGWYIQGGWVTPQVNVQQKYVTSRERFVFTGWLNGNQTVALLQDNSNMTLPLPVYSNMTLQATYTRQFFVNVTSPMGRTSGLGWYDEDSTAFIKVTPVSFPVQGFLNLLGVRTVFEGWSGDFSGSKNPGSFVVDSPKNVQAVWGTDYGLLPVLFGIAIVIVLVLMVAARRRRT